MAEKIVFKKVEKLPERLGKKLSGETITDQLRNVVGSMHSDDSFVSKPCTESQAKYMVKILRYDLIGKSDRWDYYATPNGAPTNMFVVCIQRLA